MVGSVLQILPYTKNDIKKFQGQIFADKRVASFSHLSPSKNRHMHEDIAQLKVESGSKNFSKLSSGLSIRQRDNMLEAVKQVARSADQFLKLVKEIEELYKQLDNSYGIPLKFFDFKLQ